jgi:hypothetical protein
MSALNKRNVASLTFALIIAGGYLWAVLTPPSIFNMLPLVLYDSRHSDVSSESDFIRKFDICFAVFLLILSYILAKWAYGILLARKAK